MESFCDAEQRCRALNFPLVNTSKIPEKQREESESAGISLAYIISGTFQEMARIAAGKDDPSFLVMNNPFFLDTVPERKLIREGMSCLT